jgi:hypothetical protein
MNPWHATARSTRLPLCACIIRPARAVINLRIGRSTNTYQAPLLAYASNYFELRLDGYKLLYLTK